MELITYKRGEGSASGRWLVYLAGKHVGNIRKEKIESKWTYRYYPKGSQVGGEAFSTLIECKKSLEEW